MSSTKLLTKIFNGLYLRNASAECNKQKRCLNKAGSLLDFFMVKMNGGAFQLVHFVAGIILEDSLLCHMYNGIR